MVGQTISHYRILQKLGEGGMGVVYKAEDTNLDRTVALKFLATHLLESEEHKQRFLREAKATAALDHPNICIVHEVGETNGHVFLAMGYVNGPEVRVKIKERPLKLDEALDIAIQAAEGIQAAHQKGIVHRDIKSSNLMLTSTGQLKIMDFGLAQLAGGSRLTKTDTILGSAAYMSPEQAQRLPTDRRTDLWSLGVVLYEMVTGRLPFDGEREQAVLYSIINESHEPITALRVGVPTELDRIVGKALAKNPAERYQHVDEMLVDLRAIRKSPLMAIRVAAPVQEIPRKTRRWMLTAVGAGVVSVAGGVFLARRSLFSPERRIRVAVLPFENIGGNPEESFIVEGLHQDMISVLNRLYPNRLGVIAHTSVKRYQATDATIEQIGRELEVGYVVEGGVQRHGGEVRISARLIGVRDQTPLWSATYSGEMSQILTVQARIAQAIGQGIERGLEPNAQVSRALARPLNAGAHEAYLQRNYAKAVELDPGYAAAYAALAIQLYYPTLFGFRRPREGFTSVIDAASKALALDSTQASAHAALALGNLHLQYDWLEAEDGFRRALRLNPSDPDTRHFFSHFLLWNGRSEESHRECERAVEFSPFDSGLIACRGWHALYANDSEKAIEDARLALTYQPDNRFASLVIGQAYEQKGMFQEALAALRDTFDSTLKTASIAHVFARAGNRPAAEKILEEMLVSAKTKYVSPYDIAVIYAGLEDRDRTFEWLNEAFQERSGLMVYMRSDPRFQPLRREPTFQDLLHRMSVPSQQA